jgi:hypothetical protein
VKRLECCINFRGLAASNKMKEWMEQKLQDTVDPAKVQI